MKAQVGRAAVWSIGGNGMQYVVSFFLLVYLAHALNPRDFGLIATVNIGLDLGMRIARWGQVELLQQERYRNDQARNQSFRLSLAIACAFTASFLLLAKPLGAAYHSHALSVMMLICSPVFLLAAPGATAEALLRTEYRFNLIAVRNSATALVGAIAAILLIYFGYGVVGLAIQRLIQSAMANIWVLSAVNWRPKLKGRIGWSRKLLAEGTHIMLGTLMPLLVPRSIDLFVGAWIGPTQLGLMRVGSRVNDFVGQIVVMPLVTVANTHFSTLQDELEQMRKSYLRLTQASALLMCPALIGLSLVAPEAIPLLFGAKWSGAVPFVEVVGLLGAVAPINYYFAPAMMALGRSRLVFRQGVMQVGIGLSLAFAGALISLVAVAIADVTRQTIIAIWNLVELKSAMKLRFRSVAAYLAAPYLGTLGMAIAVLILRAAVGAELNMFQRFLLLSTTGALVYGAIVLAGDKWNLWPEHAALKLGRSGSLKVATESS